MTELNIVNECETLVSQIESLGKGEDTADKSENLQSKLDMLDGTFKELENLGEKLAPLKVKKIISTETEVKISAIKEKKDTFKVFLKNFKEDEDIFLKDVSNDLRSVLYHDHTHRIRQDSMFFLLNLSL